ncbi:MAG: hypothetical protein ACO3RV_05310 [Luteolibacter sp.]
MSSPHQCPHCRAAIALDDVNVANDIALCRACGKTMPFSEIAGIPGVEDIDLSKPPKGVRFDPSTLRGKTVYFKKVSPIVFFLIPFTAMWSGISMVGIYGTQIMEGKFDPGASLFGLPFLLGTIVLVSSIAFMLFGRWRFSFHQGMLEVAMELGPFGWTRRILCDRDARVSIRQSSWKKNNQVQYHIQVNSGDKTLKFATAIPQEPKSFIAEAIRRMIASESPPSSKHL